MPWWGNLIIILAIVAVAVIIMVIQYRRNKKKAAEQQKQIDATKQTFSMLVIDKKKLRISKAGMPQMVVDQVPKLLRWRKFPIVKAKVGPRIMTFIADDSIYDQIPIKTEIKATVSGLYIVDVRGVRTSLTSSKKKATKEKKETKLDILLKKGRGEI